MFKIFVFFIIVALSSKTIAESYKKGYWWGEKKPTQSEIEKNEKEKKYTPPPLISHQQLMEMHPQELREMEEQHREYAIWKKTPEAVSNYWTIVDAARRKAKSFAAISGYVMLQKPELNARSQDPITNAGRSERSKMYKETVNKKLFDERDQFALIMFTRPGCQYCELMSQTLQLFEDTHNWNVTTVDIEINPMAGERFGVKTVPHTILIQRHTEKWMPIAVGVEPVINLERNAYRMVRYLKNEIKPEQFYMTDFQQNGYFDPNAGMEQYK